MSNPWAIAAVTETLGQLLGRIATEEASLGPLKITFGAPDKARAGQNKDARQLNLFLYRVTPNQGWANQDLPSRATDGSGSGQPVLAIDLRYLLTAYGFNDDEEDAQHVLGHAMSLLHDEAVLRRDDIRAALTAAGGGIVASDLDKQVELVRVTPDKLSDEDMVRMWTIFASAYRISVGYQASVVLISRPRSYPVAPPVREARVVAVPFRSPVITGLSPMPAHAGDVLVIAGRALAADAVDGALRQRGRGGGRRRHPRRPGERPAARDAARRRQHRAGPRLRHAARPVASGCSSRPTSRPSCSRRRSPPPSRRTGSRWPVAAR